MLSFCQRNFCSRTQTSKNRTAHFKIASCKIEDSHELVIDTTCWPFLFEKKKNFQTPSKETTFPHFQSTENVHPESVCHRRRKNWTLLLEFCRENMHKGFFHQEEKPQENEHKGLQAGNSLYNLFRSGKIHSTQHCCKRASLLPLCLVFFCNCRVHSLRFLIC